MHYEIATLTFLFAQVAISAATLIVTVTKQ